MAESLKVAGCLAVALALWLVFDGRAQEGPPVADQGKPVEVKLIGSTRCPDGWTAVRTDVGWLLPVQAGPNMIVPTWVSQPDLRYAHRRPGSEEVNEDALDATMMRLAPSPRVTCHWTPLGVGRPL